MTGRFDQAKADRFLQALRAALGEVDAAEHAGLDAGTIRRWRRRRPAFDAQVRQTKADVALLDAGRVRQASRDDWRASLALAQLAAGERELERLRELTTDA